MVASALMLLALVVLGCGATLTVSGLSCRQKEYRTRSGECCPMCQEGTFVRRDCTAQLGTRCSACDNGTFTSQANGLEKCLPCTSCDPGHGLLVQHECTVKSDTVCGVQSGYYCKSWAEDPGCSLAEKHTRCAAGHRVKSPGTNTTDTACELCPSGFFSEDGVICTLWTSCLGGQEKVKEGSRKSDVVCSSASRHHSCYISVLVIINFCWASDSM